MRWLIFFPTLLLFVACSSSTLDKTFNPELYNAYYLKMLKEKEVPTNDLFLMNYSIIRQRPYFNYKIAEKTYREILEQAKQMAANGPDVKQQFEPATPQDALRVTTELGEVSSARLMQGTALVKVFKFIATYENTTDKDVVLESSTFIIKGPLREHLTTLGYELNCVVEAKQKTKINFLIKARTIRDAVKEKSNYRVDVLGIDQVLYNLNIEVGGSVVLQTTDFYDKCYEQTGGRLPFRTFDKAIDLAEDWIVYDGGKAQVLKLGASNYEIEKTNEPTTIIPQ